MGELIIHILYEFLLFILPTFGSLKYILWENNPYFIWFSGKNKIKNFVTKLIKLIRICLSFHECQTQGPRSRAQKRKGRRARPAGGPKLRGPSDGLVGPPPFPHSSSLSSFHSLFPPCVQACTMAQRDNAQLASSAHLPHSPSLSPVRAAHQMAQPKPSSQLSSAHSFSYFPHG